jgi:diguanylate cyclase (GGDEF)-like protein
MLQAEDGPRLAILDRNLAGLDGLDVCRQVRADSRLNYVYILVLTDQKQTQDLVAAIDAGADDSIARPLHSQELRARLRAGTRVVQLQERLLRAREELYEQATRDGLTRVWNRVTILQILDNEFARVQRGGAPLALLMIDLDHFKRINDQHGHLAGDAVLRDVSRRMSSLLRQYDSVGRYGGEEFLVVVPGCDIVSAMAVADRLRILIEAEPFAIPQGEVPLTCSIGVACTDCSTPKDVNELLHEADTALYVAKRRGRNRVEYFGWRSEAEAQAELNLA